MSVTNEALNKYLYFDPESNKFGLGCKNANTSLYLLLYELLSDEAVDLTYGAKEVVFLPFVDQPENIWFKVKNTMIDCPYKKGEENSYLQVPADGSIGINLKKYFLPIEREVFEYFGYKTETSEHGTKCIFGWFFNSPMIGKKLGIRDRSQIPFIDIETQLLFLSVNSLVCPSSRVLEGVNRCDLYLLPGLRRDGNRVVASPMSKRIIDHTAEIVTDIAAPPVAPAVAPAAAHAVPASVNTPVLKRESSCSSQMSGSQTRTQSSQRSISRNRKASSQQSMNLPFPVEEWQLIWSTLHSYGWTQDYSRDRSGNDFYPPFPSRSNALRKTARVPGFAMFDELAVQLHIQNYPFLSLDWDESSPPIAVTSACSNVRSSPVKLPEAVRLSQNSFKCNNLRTLLLKNNWKCSSGEWRYSPCHNLMQRVQNKCKEFIAAACQTQSKVQSLNGVMNYSYPAHGIHVFEEDSTEFSRFIHRFPYLVEANSEVLKATLQVNFGFVLISPDVWDIPLSCEPGAYRYRVELSENELKVLLWLVPWVLITGQYEPALSVVINTNLLQPSKAELPSNKKIAQSQSQSPSHQYNSNTTVANSSRVKDHFVPPSSSILLEDPLDTDSNDMDVENESLSSSSSSSSSSCVKRSPKTKAKHPNSKKMKMSALVEFLQKDITDSVNMYDAGALLTDAGWQHLKCAEMRGTIVEGATVRGKKSVKLLDFVDCWVAPWALVESVDFDQEKTLQAGAVLGRDFFYDFEDVVAFVSEFATASDRGGQERVLTCKPPLDQVLPEPTDCANMEIKEWVDLVARKKFNLGSLYSFYHIEQLLIDGLRWKCSEVGGRRIITAPWHADNVSTENMTWFDQKSGERVLMYIRTYGIRKVESSELSDKAKLDQLLTECDTTYAATKGSFPGFEELLEYLVTVSGWLKEYPSREWLKSAGLDASALVYVAYWAADLYNDSKDSRHPDMIECRHYFVDRVAMIEYLRKYGNSHSGTDVTPKKLGRRAAQQSRISVVTVQQPMSVPRTKPSKLPLKKNSRSLIYSPTPVASDAAIAAVSTPDAEEEEDDEEDLDMKIKHLVHEDTYKGDFKTVFEVLKKTGWISEYAPGSATNWPHQGLIWIPYWSVEKVKDKNIFKFESNFELNREFFIEQSDLIEYLRRKGNVPVDSKATPEKRRKRGVAAATLAPAAVVIAEGSKKKKAKTVAVITATPATKANSAPSSCRSTGSDGSPGAKFRHTYGLQLQDDGTYTGWGKLISFLLTSNFNRLVKWISLDAKGKKSKLEKEWLAYKKIPSGATVYIPHWGIEQWEDVDKLRDDMMRGVDFFVSPKEVVEHLLVYGNHPVTKPKSKTAVTASVTAVASTAEKGSSKRDVFDFAPSPLNDSLGIGISPVSGREHINVSTLVPRTKPEDVAPHLQLSLEFSGDLQSVLMAAFELRLSLMELDNKDKFNKATGKWTKYETTVKDVLTEMGWAWISVGFGNGLVIVSPLLRSAFDNESNKNKFFEFNVLHSSDWIENRHFFLSLDAFNGFFYNQLEAAGYDYEAVHKALNEDLNPETQDLEADFESINMDGYAKDTDLNTTATIAANNIESAGDEWGELEDPGEAIDAMNRSLSAEAVVSSTRLDDNCGPSGQQPHHQSQQQNKLLRPSYSGQARRQDFLRNANLMEKFEEEGCDDYSDTEVTTDVAVAGCGGDDGVDALPCTGDIGDYNDGSFMIHGASKVFPSSSTFSAANNCDGGGHVCDDNAVDSPESMNSSTISADDPLIEALAQSNCNFETVLWILTKNCGWRWEYLRSTRIYKKNIVVPAEYFEKRIFLSSNYMKNGKNMINPILNEDYFFEAEPLVDYLRTYYGLQPENKFKADGSLKDDVSGAGGGLGLRLGLGEKDSLALLPRSTRARSLSTTADMNCINSSSSCTGRKSRARPSTVPAVGDVEELNICSPVMATTATKTWNLPGTVASTLFTSTTTCNTTQGDYTSASTFTSANTSANTADASSLDIGIGINSTARTPLLSFAPALTDVQKLRKLSKNLSFTDNIDEMMYQGDQLLVGREKETKELLDKLQHGIQNNQGFVMNIHGQTSFGKTTIVRYAVDHVIRNLGTGMENVGAVTQAGIRKKRKVTPHRTAQMLWTTNSTGLLKQAQDKLKSMDGDNETLVYVIDEADWACQLHTTANHVGGSGNINLKNFQDLKSLISLATADSSNLILLTIGNTCIFPDEMRNVDVSLALGSNKYEDVEFLTLVKNGMNKDRLSSLLFDRYDEQQLVNLMNARLREFVDVEAYKDPIQLLAKKAVNEISSTRYMFNLLDHLFSQRRQKAEEAEKKRKGDTGSSQNSDSHNCSAITDSEIETGSMHPSLVGKTGQQQQSDPKLFEISMREMMAACGDMKPTPKSEIMVGNQCTCCRYLLEAFHNMEAYNCCFSKRDICNAYYEFAQQHKLSLCSDGSEVTTTDIMMCMRNHMEPNGLVADGSAGNRGGKSLRMDNETTRKYSLLYAESDYNIYKTKVAKQVMA